MSPLAARGMLSAVVGKTLAQRSDVDAVRIVAELSWVDLAHANGKGAKLAELTRARPLVPPGLVVRSPADVEEAARSSIDEPGFG